MFSIAQITEDSLMESDGVGLIVWFQGCRGLCEGCQNPELHSFQGGLETDVSIFDSYDLSWVDNFVLLGGEPLDQSKGVVEVAQYAHEKGKKVWMYTGYSFEEIEQDVLNNVDVIIDGRYMKEYESNNIRYRGSSNQRVLIKINGQWEDKTNDIGLADNVFKEVKVNISKE